MKNSFNTPGTQNKGKIKIVVAADVWKFLHTVKFLTFISAQNVQVLAPRFGVYPETLAFLIAAYGGRVSYGS